MAISVGHDGVDLSGWKAADGKTFGYTDGGRTRMQVFVREVEAGQRIVIPQGTWTGGLLLLPNE
jgi:2-methylisocitrate lyase-like PEP mutase family enzyme